MVLSSICLTALGKIGGNDVLGKKDKCHGTGSLMLSEELLELTRLLSS